MLPNTRLSMHSHTRLSTHSNTRLSTHSRTGITQDQINQTRSAEERGIIADLSVMIRGNNFNADKRDATGASYVSSQLHDPLHVSLHESLHESLTKFSCVCRYASSSTLLEPGRLTHCENNLELILNLLQQFSFNTLFELFSAVAAAAAAVACCLYSRVLMSV